MEIYKGIHQIQSLYGGRNLFQYLFVGDNVVLVDTGVAETPEKAIFPYMDAAKVDLHRLTMAVITHPDVDHQGGNQAIKAAAKQTLLACGEADREMVEDPRTLFKLRYNFAREQHGVGFDSDGPWPDAGQRQVIDIGFTGGEKIRIGEEWELDVLHVPGHSRGHLALYDAAHKAAFVSDAIHGRGCPNADGSVGIPVTYYFIDTYLSTLRYLENLAIDVLYSGHWPIMRGEQVRDFIGESRQTVEMIDRVILDSLTRNPGGRSLRELIDEVANAVGDWPKDTWFLAMFPVKGHLDRLEQQNRIRMISGAGYPKWQMS